MAESSPTTPKPRRTSSMDIPPRLQCSKCLDVFSDPVSTPCGHNFCRICLKQFWDNRQIYSCPDCKKTFEKRPELKINTTLKQLTLIFKEELSLRRSEVLCDICDDRKLKALKLCLTCQASYCEKHLEPHQRVLNLKKHKLMDLDENLKDNISEKHERQLMKIQTDVQKRIQMIQDIKHSAEVRKRNREQEKAVSVEIFSDLIRLIERSQTELMKMMEEEEKAAEEHDEDLEQKIAELKFTESVLTKIKPSQYHLIQIDSPPYSVPETKNWSEISMKSHVSLEALRRSLTQIQETLNKKSDQIGLIQSQQYAVDVTLDPDTAQPYLILSEDRKQVKHGDISQNLPNNKQRFHIKAFVLGKEGFSSGRFYFEVQVKDKTDWDVGVTRESVNRKGEIKLSPQDGFWTVSLRNDNKYKAYANPPVSLSLKVKVMKVGVFVDYEEGLVCFYDVDSRSHIYSYTHQTFTEKLFPLFSPCANDKGKNSSPLIITPVHYNK